MSGAGGDQTRGDSIPVPHGSGAVWLSLGEVAALCTKAARGAGMEWGVAEEAGHAAAWLAGHGMDGPRLLLALLSEHEDARWAAIRPVPSEGGWRPAGARPICPIALGITLCDHAALPDGAFSAGLPVRMGPVARPALLLPFLAAAAEASGRTLVLDWDGGAAAIGGPDGWPTWAVRMLDTAAIPSLVLISRPGAPAAMSVCPPPPVDAGTIGGLGALAMRTTVPASAASRAGAGAAAGDND